MKDNLVKVNGITPIDKFPPCPANHPCIEICKTDKLCIPCKKPDIKDICEIFVDISICDFKTINTPMGKKLVIEGIEHIKIVYTADTPCQNVHSAHFNVPFCTFVLLKNICRKVVDVYAAVEYASVKLIDCKCFAISTIIFICPLFQKKPHHHCNENNDCYCTDYTYCSNDHCLHECNNIEFDYDNSDSYNDNEVKWDNCDCS
ncbi:DUF3794 domain-containing protein [Clostridium aestuarii]|uniref:DUF3794 domain-containing protein n=1 Tax=Clostridium aestuarii TaxID=338193 RepID=A0ABT4CYH6_9CLOT|nr:DUF3794 domain-containing protein [Clostridium aestuarii]MCY6483170.1 DUF3794 domain-containing protein [Clostridium aestuarii]